VTLDVPYHGVVGATLLLPTRAFRTVGGHDDAFFMNSEEIDPIGAVVTRDGSAGGTVGGVPAQDIDSGPLPGAGS